MSDKKKTSNKTKLNPCQLNLETIRRIAGKNNTCTLWQPPASSDTAGFWSLSESNHFLLLHSINPQPTPSITLPYMYISLHNPALMNSGNKATLKVKNKRSRASLSGSLDLLYPNPTLCPQMSSEGLPLTCKLLRAWSMSVTELSVVVATGMELGMDACASFTWNCVCMCVVRVCVCVYVCECACVCKCECVCMWPSS